MKNYNAQRAMLSGTVDYAGTFPPASLSFEEAIKEAATCQSALHQPWIFGKVVLTLPMLKSINPRTLIQAGSNRSPWQFAALSSEVPSQLSTEEFSRLLEWDRREISRFNERNAFSSVQSLVIGYEVKLPECAFTDVEAMNDFLLPALDRLTGFSSSVLSFFEVPKGPDWGSRIKSVASVLSHWQSEVSEPMAPGIKVRTGGDCALTLQDLAQAICETVGHGLRFKATQGLHNAITINDNFGFVNLLSALTLTQSLGLSRFPLEKVKACLTCSNSIDFQFGDDFFSWHDFSVDVDKIEAARRRHSGSFGSCSIIEPDESLYSQFNANA